MIPDIREEGVHTFEEWCKTDDAAALIGVFDSRDVKKISDLGRAIWGAAKASASTPEAAGRVNEDRWIPCTERLPEEETPVLIMLRGRVRIGERRWERPTYEESFRAFWYWDDPENDGQDWDTFDITSWRPLPAPDSGEQHAD